MTDQLFPVPFYQDTLVLVDHDGQPFVAMKPIVENMGLAWQAQHVKLTDKFGSTITIITTVAEDGKNREMVCLPLRKIPAFLYSVNPSKVKPELREKIVRYQSECDNALWDYWTSGSASRPGAALNDAQFISLNRSATALLQQLQRETDPEARRFVHDQLVRVSQKLGIQPPALEKIGHAALPDHESPLIEEFWEIFDLVLAVPTSKLNHSRSKELIAINMPQVRAAATAAKLALPEISELRRVLKHSRSPRFVGIKTVNSQHTRSAVKCWVFEAETVNE
ncbi:MAG: phage antirepressor N-terminal domain-containing protein [Nitrosomonadales bacterium]|nr:phage antirepressor N-terminal domain-containing protein [Nitrosomonadales bacterium]